MKKWEMPAVEELTLSETMYGGSTVTEFDNLYMNDEGNWEATFS